MVTHDSSIPAGAARDDGLMHAIHPLSGTDRSVSRPGRFGADGNLYAGGLSVGNSDSRWDWCWPVSHHHTTYETEAPTKFETAFKIVSKLLEKKIVERLTVKQFIELMNEIAVIV